MEVFTIIDSTDKKIDEPVRIVIPDNQQENTDKLRGGGIGDSTVTCCAICIAVTITLAFLIGGIAAAATSNTTGAAVCFIIVFLCCCADCGGGYWYTNK